MALLLLVVVVVVVVVKTSVASKANPLIWARMEAVN